MAPEHLRAFRDRVGVPDSRSDIYSLGIILFELLTARSPFPARRGRVTDILPSMLEDQQRTPSIRAINKDISPAVESILRHCLAPDPAQRYQTARALQEDIERHLKNLPLHHAPELSWRERAAKWVRRHPRLTSSSAVASAAALLLMALGGSLFGYQQHAARLEAAETLRTFHSELRTASRAPQRTVGRPRPSQ